MTWRFQVFDAFHFLTFLQNDEFRSAVRRHTDLGPIVEAVDVVERSASLRTHLESHWDDARSEVETLMRRWCDALAIPADQRPDDLADRLVFVLDQETQMIRVDFATLAAIAGHDYTAIETCPVGVAAEIRRIVPRDLWASTYLLLTPDDPPGADSTTEASMLLDLCVRTGIWRLHRLLVDPDSVPPRGFAASDAIRVALHLPPRTPSSSVGP